MGELARNLATMFGLSWAADRWRSLAALLTCAVLPVSMSLRAVGMAMVADGVVTGRQGRAMVGVALIAGLTGLSHVVEWANTATRMRLREHTILYLDQRVMELVAGLPGLEHHERADYQDRMELLQRQRGSLVNPFMPIPWTLANVIQLVTTVAILGRLHPALIALPVAGIPSLFASTVTERRWRRLWTHQAEDQRVLAHLFELGTQPAAAKEVRLFGLADELDRRRRARYEELERRRVATSIWAAVVNAGGWACFALGYVAGVALVVDRAVHGALSVGDVVLVLTLGGQVNAQVANLVQNTVWFNRTTEAIGHYRWLVAHATRAHAELAAGQPGPAPSRIDLGITFRDVGFTYPGTDAAVLTGVDLLLPAGAIVAVVGENGAGKTTLVKLLLRFYDPTEGVVAVDGVDLRAIDIAAWRARTSAGFQDFARLQLLARQSVGVGALDHVDEEIAVLGALDRGGGGDLVTTLPEGLDTQLGREFGAGVDLSTGQWQKVALGRAMMRDDPLLLVLDEPTASLDATTEHALYEGFASQARRAGAGTGAVTVLVSHRFSTVRMAELILVVADGTVAESGTHEELVRLGGHYAALYRLQARGYA
jgi:ATP-binding cassette subfamily B protein